MTNSEQFNTQLSKATDNLITSIEDINQKINFQGKRLKKYQNLLKMLQIVLKIRRNLLFKFTIRRDWEMQTSLSNISETIGKLSELQEGIYSWSNKHSPSTMQTRGMIIKIDLRELMKVSWISWNFGKFMNANQQNAQVL